MNESVLEHINLTVPDPQATADLLCDLFGWHVRWQGEAKNAGFTIHVGGHGSYLALYRHQDMAVDTAAWSRTRTLTTSRVDASTSMMKMAWSSRSSPTLRMHELSR